MNEADDEIPKVLRAESGPEFIAFCLDQLRKGGTIPEVWHDWRGQVARSDPKAS